MSTEFPRLVSLGDKGWTLDSNDIILTPDSRHVTNIIAGATSGEFEVEFEGILRVYRIGLMRNFLSTPALFLPFSGTLIIKAPECITVNSANPLRVLAYYSNGTNRDVTNECSFSLSNEGVISIDDDKFVIGSAVGEVSIFAETNDGKMASFTNMIVVDSESDLFSQSYWSGQPDFKPV